MVSIGQRGPNYSRNEGAAHGSWLHSVQFSDNGGVYQNGGQTFDFRAKTWRAKRNIYGTLNPIPANAAPESANLYLNIVPVITNILSPVYGYVTYPNKTSTTWPKKAVEIKNATNGATETVGIDCRGYPR